MHPIAFNEFADSPTLLLQPQYLPHHPFCAASSSAHSYRYQSFTPMMPPNPLGSLPIRTPPATPHETPPSNSKKRSRESPSIEDTLGAPGEELDDVDMLLPQTPAISPERVSGDSLPVINPLTSQPTGTGDQSGAWMESKLAEGLATGLREHVVLTDHSEDLSTKRKCVRFEASSSSSSGAGSVEPLNPSYEAPEHDQFTRALGIGWIPIGQDPDVLAAVRGYRRYIENHYPLTNVEVLVESKSLDAYLVKTDEGYYLFSEDLKEGILVETHFEDTIARLQKSEIRFGGSDSLHAAATPAKSLSDDNAKGSPDIELNDNAENGTMT